LKKLEINERKITINAERIRRHNLNNRKNKEKQLEKNNYKKLIK
jgi:hypothetical protein